MKNNVPREIRTALGAALFGLSFLVSFPGRAAAQNPDFRQTVARISYLSGDVSYSRGDDPDDWQAASVNIPFTLGDRVYSPDNGQVELQIHGGEFLRLAARTDLAALNLTDDVRQFSLTEGTASVQLRRMDEGETFEVDTPNVAVTFERPGDYRIDVDPSGNTRVSCFQGEATVAAAGGEVPLGQGSQMWIDGIDDPQYDVGPLDRRDSWDNWVAGRESRFARVSSTAYVNFNIDGIDDLDEYGRWVDVPSYGRCWTPSRIEFGWQPYRSGRWAWQDPWGWTWIADEPWGWAPYHYGRWVVYSSRWYWVPVGPSAAVSYSPALVAFVGGGPGWSLSLAAGGGGYVGWFPLGPRDPFYRWWGSGSRFRAEAPDARFMNRSYVTVVSQNTFVSGGIVSAAAVRDPQVVRQIAAAPVIRGPIPVVPTAGSLRVSARAGAALSRPPVSIASRPVVTRIAPPPAPARFQEKLQAIRENRGAPVTPAAAAQMSIVSRGGARAVSPVRPVTVEQGHVAFQPRNGQSAAPKAAPVTERHGRPLATMQRPIVSAPSAAPGGEPPAKIAPGAVVLPRNISPPPSREGEPRALERRNTPPPPAHPSAQPAPPESWRTRQAPPPPPPPDQAPPPPRQEFRRVPPPPPPPPPDQAPPPPRQEFRRVPPPPPPPPQDQAPPPPPRERRVEPVPGSNPPPNRPDAARSRDAERGNRAAEKDKGKGKDKEKDKGKKPPPPPPQG